ncbi:MAG: inositol monophosphatase family protein [Dehalococcoidia bacterium]|nr:inositol monophosphatase family protein [Dehalococcoidia bacterium]
MPTYIQSHPGHEPLPQAKSGKSAMDVARRAALAAGDVLVQRYSHAKTVKWKGKSNITTDADIAAEEAIVRIIEAEYPTHNIVAEESGKSEQQSEYSWLVDPLDGTNNFLFGIPFFAVTIGLTAGDQVLLGVTYDPMRREMFHGEVDSPSRLNGEEIFASKRTNLRDALIGFDVGYKPEKGLQVLEFAPELWRQAHGVRLMGSAALGLAYVASGRLDVYCHRCLYPWDIAAGLLIVRNSGGLVTDWDGTRATPKTDQIIAAGKSIHSTFRDWHASWERSKS